jgi:hypothetical protein
MYNLTDIIIDVNKKKSFFKISIGCAHGAGECRM